MSLKIGCMMLNQSQGLKIMDLGCRMILTLIIFYRRRVLPELGESDEDMDPSQSIPRLINYYINCIREEGKRIYSYRGHQDSSFITR